MTGAPVHSAIALSGDQVASNVDLIRSMFELGVTNLRLDWRSDDPAVEMEALALPGLVLSRGFAAPSMSQTADISRGSTDYVMTWTTSGARGYATQAGRDVSASRVVFFSCEERIVANSYDDFHHVNVRLSQAALRSLVPDADSRIGQGDVPLDDPALRMLNAYIHSLDWALLANRTDLGRLAALHITDLSAIVLGARKDERHLALERGGNAARLQLVKNWVAQHSGRQGLSIGDAARAHGVSPRTLQALFARDGTTFTDFLLEQRLTSARHAAQASDCSISEIAFASGFGDLSHFNHRYRARFGEAPSDTRARTAPSC